MIGDVIVNNNDSNNSNFAVGDRIIFLRNQKNLTTTALARKAGISQAYLRDIELQHKNPTVKLLESICDVLEISLKDFFDVDDGFGNLLREDPLSKIVFKLNEDQRNTLLAFISSMQKKD